MRRRVRLRLRLRGMKRIIMIEMEDMYVLWQYLELNSVHLYYYGATIDNG